MKPGSPLIFSNIVSYSATTVWFEGWFEGWTVWSKSEVSSQQFPEIRTNGDHSHLISLISLGLIYGRLGY